MKFLIICVCALISGLAMAQGLLPSNLPELPEHVEVLKIGPDFYDMHSFTRKPNESTLLHLFTPHHSVSLDMSGANAQTKNAMTLMEQNLASTKTEDRIYFLCQASTDRIDGFNLKVKKIDFCIDTRNNQVVINLLPRLITINEIQAVMREGQRNPEDEMVNNSSRDLKKQEQPLLSLEDFEPTSSRQ